MAKKRSKSLQKPKKLPFDPVSELGVFAVSHDLLRIGDASQARETNDHVLEFDSLRPGPWLATVTRHERGPQQGQLDSLIVQHIETLESDLDWRWVEQPIQLDQSYVTILATEDWHAVTIPFDFALFPAGLMHRTELPKGQFDVAAAHENDQCVAIEVMLNHGSE